MNEEWRPVVGWEECYEVSSLGRVASKLHRLPRLLTPQDNGGGYFTVMFRDGKRHCIHHLVAAAFIGPRPLGLDVCHNNGNNGDNAARNLRYDTRSNNHRDKVRHGTDNRGEKHYGARLTDADVAEIRRLNTGGWTQADIAARFGVSQAHVSNIALFRRRAGDRSTRQAGVPC